MLALKRKAPSSSNLECPRFISIGMATRTIPNNVAPPQPVLQIQCFRDDKNFTIKASFSTLPHELFCNVISYLGPTSSSLCALHQVNRDHHTKLTTIGNIMLHRAHLRFRTPLSPLSLHESTVSLFVRHARVSKIVHDACEILDSILKKDFPAFSSDGTDLEDDNKPAYINIFVDNCRAIVEPNEVNNALNTALCLLGSGKPRYFEDDPFRADAISASAATSALEWRVLNLCSRLGAKAYKYAKSRMCLMYGHEDYHLSTHYATVSDEMELDNYSDDEEDDISLDFSEMEVDQNASLLEKASMVLQLVVLQDKHTAYKHISQIGGTSELSHILPGTK